MSQESGKINWRSLAAATVAGLLNSSCCVVQLGLNWMSIGCAGFAVLDPLRPVFLTASYGSLATSIIYGHLYQGKQLITRDILVTTLLISALSLSPEIVNLVNERRLPFFSSRPDKAQVREILHFSIEGMKCKACANNVKNHLEKVSRSCKAIVIQEESRAEILCEGDESVDPAPFIQAVHETTDPPGDFVAKLLRREKAGVDASEKIEKLAKIHHADEDAELTPDSTESVCSAASS